MFKGLRTKIESEQKGQAKPKDGNQTQTKSGTSTPKENALQPNAKSEQAIAPTLSEPRNQNESLSGGSNLSPLSTISQQHSNLPTSLETPNLKQGHDQIAGENLHPLDRDSEGQMITALRDQLNKVTKERDESNDQNAQLYQIIEKLRRNLETEKETNSNLQARLKEVEGELKEKSQKPDNARGVNQNFSKSINLDKLVSAHLSTTDDVDTLKHEIIELQAQLSMKNRQLKIRQQNLNDLKRTLQKEMLSHNKTQDELKKLQNQLREQERCISQDDKDFSSSQQNGSNKNEANSNSTTKGDTVNQSSNENNHDFGQPSNIPLVISGLSEGDNISLSAVGSGLAQLDRISYQSRSTASVDEFESNDLHQSSFSKEVSHEYLKNVLYRYMTSTETETMRHLIKAISVIMDFSPEQSAAIKSAMNARTSWLRLK